jgi:hypothetical protein
MSAPANDPITPPGTAKAATTTTTANFLDMLPDDTLQAILLRTGGSDHTNLSLTCRRIRDMLKSLVYKKERWTHGVAQVTTIVSKDDEDNDYDYGTIRNTGIIVVDGKRGGSLMYTLVPRRNTDVFHEACDDVSADLQEAGTLFCDAHGRIRLASVKQAMAATTTNKRGYFCYIDKLELEYEYRDSTNTWIGAQAIRSLLMESDNLGGQWSLAVYIPAAQPQFNQADVELRQSRTFSRGDESLSVEGTKELEAWRKRCRDLTKLDMRQFFRAGFQQAKETVEESDYFQLFCVPTALQVNLKSMMPHEKALLVPITEKKSRTGGPTGSSKELLDLMVSSCTSRRSYKNAIQEYSPEALRQNPMFRDQYEQTTALRSKMEEVMATIESLEQRLLHEEQERNVLLERKRRGTNNGQDLLLEDQWAVANARVADAEAKAIKVREVRGLIQEYTDKIQEQQDKLDLWANETREKAENELKDADSRVRADVITHLADCNDQEAIIAESNAIHACACNLDTDYVELLLSFVSRQNQWKTINKVDVHGVTPLMLAAGSNLSTSADNRFQVCENIISLGADKDITDDTGLTALGHFRKSERATHDQAQVFGMSMLDANRPEDWAQRMERLLVPSNGPTAQDQSIVQNEEMSEGEADEWVDAMQASDEDDSDGEHDGGEDDAMSDESFGDDAELPDVVDGGPLN